MDMHVRFASRWRFGPPMMKHQQQRGTNYNGKKHNLHIVCQVHADDPKKQLHNMPEIPLNAFLLPPRALIKIRLDIRRAFSPDLLILLGIIHSERLRISGLSLSLYALSRVVAWILHDGDAVCSGGELWRDERESPIELIDYKICKWNFHWHPGAFVLPKKRKIWMKRRTSATCQMFKQEHQRRRRHTQLIEIMEKWKWINHRLSLDVHENVLRTDVDEIIFLAAFTSPLVTSAAIQ